MGLGNILDNIIAEYEEQVRKLKADIEIRDIHIKKLQSELETLKKKEDN